MHQIGRVTVLHEVVLEISFGRDRGKVYCSRVDVYHLAVGLPVFRVSGRRLAEILPDVTGPLLASREIRGCPEQAAGDLSFGASHVATVRGTCGSSPTSRQRRTSPYAPPIEIEVHTEWGEQVYLYGNLEALGTGDPRHALRPLSADDYSVWRTEIDVPADTYFEFQWIKKREGRTVEWSPCGYAMEAGDGEVWRLE